MKITKLMRGVTTLLALFMIAGFLGCGGVEQTETTVVRPAKLVTVGSASTQRTLTFPAVIEARSTAELTFPVGGTLEQILVRAGDEVAQGTVIARLEARSFRNAVSSAQTQFNTAVAEFTRADRLWAENAIARNVYEQRQAALEVARAALDDARKALEDSVLTSPFDGVVAIRHLDENQNVGVGQPIVTVQTTADAIINVPATLVANANYIEPTGATVILDANRDIRMSATLAETSTAADPTTQTFSASFLFYPPEDLNVLPGMTATVESQIEILHSDFVAQVSIPIGAIVSDGAEEYVWRVDPDTMTVSRQDITTGIRVGDEIVVLTGLEMGETIVGAGAAYLHEGMQISAYEAGAGQ